MDVFEVIKKQEREKGIAEGRQEGKLKSMLHVALEMKKEGISIEKIARYTQLPLSDIEALN